MNDPGSQWQSHSCYIVVFFFFKFHSVPNYIIPCGHVYCVYLSCWFYPPKVWVWFYEQQLGWHTQLHHWPTCTPSKSNCHVMASRYMFYIIIPIQSSLSLYLYMYIQKHLYAWTYYNHMCIYIYISICTQSYVYIYICKHIHIYICKYENIYICKYIYMQTYVDVNFYICKHIHIYM